MISTEAVKDKFYQTIKKYDMLGEKDALLCGYSGGADSTALLHLLHTFCTGNRIRIAAVHVNHRIRGEAADRDQQHCIRFCRERDIELFVRSADVPSLAAASNTGIEETARRERYRIFGELCVSEGFTKIATAHNSGDNLETVLFNLLRGTGIRGLCGIPPVRGAVIRPLIECSKEEITGYCRENGLGYASDETNGDPAYTRNFIRSEIVPLILRVNSRAEANVLRMCSQLRRDSDFLDGLALNDPRFASDSRDALLSRRIIQGYSAFAGGGQLQAVHVADALKLLKEGRLHGSVSLPSGIAMRKTRTGFVFEKGRKKPDEPFSCPLGEGKNDLGKAGAVFLCKNINDIKEIKNIYKLFIYITLYSDKMKGVIYIRNRRNGDVIRSGGMTKSVKKLLGEKQTDPAERDLLPFVCDGEGLLWIPGIAVRDGAEKRGGNDENDENNENGKDTVVIGYAK